MTVIAEQSAVIAGEPVTWDVSIRNLTSGPLLLRLFGGLTPPYDRFGQPVEQGTDGDDTFGPGEIWVWRYTAVVTVDMSFLAVEASVARPGEPLAQYLGGHGRSDPISVSSAPTTTITPPTTATPEPPPADGLPATGADDHVALIALFALTVGSTLLIAGRRRSVPHR